MEMQQLSLEEGPSLHVDSEGEAMVLRCSSGDFMASWGQWCNSGECSQDLFKRRHEWVTSFNRQLFSFLFAHHHQSENHKLSMWNCTFVWHVIASTCTKFPTCGSLPLPAVLVTHRRHPRYFPTSCLLAPLLSRLALAQPKSSSWHPTLSNNCISIHTGSVATAD